MTRRPPRAGMARADLLRALAAGGRDAVTLDADHRGWFGYERQTAAPVPLRTPVGLPPVVGEPLPPAPRRLPLRVPHLAVVAEHVPLQTRPAVTARRTLRPEQREPDHAAPLSAVRLTAYDPIVPWPRLLPRLRPWVSTTRPGAIDVGRLTSAVACGRVPASIPRLQRASPDPELVLVLDFSERLAPYWMDMHRLARRLLEVHGRWSMSARIVSGATLDGWQDWRAHQEPEPRPGTVEHAEWERRRQARPWAMPPPGARLLVVSDLGSFEGAGGREGARAEWAAFLKRATKAGVRPVVLAPVGSARVDPLRARDVPVIRWSPDGTMRPEHPRGAADQESEDVSDVLAMMSQARRVDPPLLRALRHADRSAPGDAGMEGAVWNHPDVHVLTYACVVRADAHRDHAARFSEFAPERQETVRRLIRRHHAHLPAALTHEETLLWNAWASDEARRGAANDVGVAELFFEQVAEVVELGRADTARWAELAYVVAWGAEARLRDSQRDLFDKLDEVVLRRLPPDTAIPSDARDDLAMAASSRATPVRLWLVDDRKLGSVRLQPEEPAAGQWLLAGPLEASVVDVEAGRPPVRRRLDPQEAPFDLARGGQDLFVRLRTPAGRITVAALGRPRGAGGWGRDRDGWFVDSPPVGDRQVCFKPRALEMVPAPGSAAWMARAAPEPAPGPSVAPPIVFGIDEFGCFADVTLRGVTQRFRWIEPGTFWMGSPADEPERQDREGPRHQVTLTAGFWLADTACTQALWVAVTGANPSWFTGDPRRPVEQVSWNDVQGFLARLQRELPSGCAAGLPAEAEWEYACRAGTETPFSFGRQITPAVVNYDGNYPYAGGPKGEYRGQTVAVGSLPANPWGLYEMHGNVDEWCADGQRAYGPEAVVDPRGPEGRGASRVVRGGSWFDGAGRCRSACRNRVQRVYRNDGLGFRLALRSIEPGGARS